MEKEKEKDDEKLPTYIVNIPEPQSPEPLIPLRQEEYISLLSKYKYIFIIANISTNPLRVYN